MPTQVGIRELLEAGVHFGHQTRRWNPKMRRFIFGERAGIYLIDLLKTEALLAQAQQFADEIARRGGTVLFVGTKKQARDGIKEIAESAGQPYVNHRWLGGLLTNFQTISNRIKRLHDLERYETEGQLALLPTRERLSALADLEKLRANLGGVKNMQRVPDAMFVVDLKTEEIAVREAQRLRIPVIGLVDTNCDPDGIAYVIPGNDDAMRACNIITRAIGDTIAEGRARFRAEEEEARRQAEEQARREAEEKARREAEEDARKEAEALAAAEALTHGGEGEPRDVAEAQVAEAVESLGRPQAEGRRSAEAAAAAQAADEPAAPAGGGANPPRRQRQNPNAGERTPQAAGAPQGEGAPASDTIGEGADAPAASRARQRTRKPKAAATAAPDGPSDIAKQAEAEAPADPEAADAQAAEGAAVVEAAQAEAAGAEPQAPAAEPEAPVADPATPAAEPEAPTAEPEAPAAAEDEGSDEGLVDRAQDAANQAVDTAQDVAAGAAGVAEAAAEAVAEAAPGPLKGVAKAAAAAAGAVENVVANSDDDDDAENGNETSEKDSK
ncbi:MAG: small subunit ribosomal protein [Solirubrobacteraceae bacterium]|nr:small subunit ribosomal protein [Solirubrobacteraceae bacterium]